MEYLFYGFIYREHLGCNTSEEVKAGTKRRYDLTQVNLAVFVHIVTGKVFP